MELTVKRIRKTLILTLLLEILCNNVAISSASVQIEWEVLNRYRVFDYEDGSKRRSPKDSAAMLSPFLIQKNGLRPETTEEWLNRVSVLPSPLGSHSGPWIEETALYEKDFVEPPKHFFLRAKITDNDSSVRFSDQECSWRTAGIEVKQSCDKPFEQEDFDSDGATLSVFGADTELASVFVKPRLIIILGLGDSYAAGEGTPDVPTIWRTQTPHKYWPPRNKESVSDYVHSGAKWWSNRCDRSFHSYQNLVALHRAASEQQSFIAFVHLACSGAEIIDGVLAPQRFPPGHKVGDCLPPKDRSDSDIREDCDVPYSQLHAAARLLCLDQVTSLPAPLISAIRAPLNSLRNGKGQWKWTTDLITCSQIRPVEQVLLSIGGNDIGFSGIIASVLMPTSTRIPKPIGYLGQWVVDIARKEGKAVCPYARADKKCDVMEADLRIKELPMRYEALKRALEPILRVRSEQVILNQYPNPLYCTRTILCGDKQYSEKNGAWEATQVLLPKDAQIGKWQINLTQGEAEEVDGHNVKALNKTITAAGNRNHWKIAPLESVMIEHGWQTGKDVALMAYTDLAQWKPNASHTRFIRTSNDSFLTQWPSKERENGFNGTFHPNAQGYAAMAHGVLQLIQQTLK